MKLFYFQGCQLILGQDSQRTFVLNVYKIEALFIDCLTLLPIFARYFEAPADVDALPDFDTFRHSTESMFDYQQVAETNRVIWVAQEKNVYIGACT